MKRENIIWKDYKNLEIKWCGSRISIYSKENRMNDFDFCDSYDYSAYVEAFEQGVDDVDFPDDIGQDMSEYEINIIPGEGDWSDVFDLGDEEDEDGDYSDCE